MTLITVAQSWEYVGSGLNGNVYDLQQFKDKLYAVGRMGVKYWDGSSWMGLPRPFGIGTPLALAVYDDTLYVGGNFQSGSTLNVYKYDGTDWIQVGGNLDDTSWSSVRQLLTFNGQLISGGRYTSINGATIYNIASWNGITWNSLGSGLNGSVGHLAEHRNKLYATGDFTAAGADTTVRHIARWDGTNWTDLGTTHSFRSAGPIISFNNSLFIGGVWDTIAGIPMKGIASWDGTSFASRGNNLIHRVNNFWVFNNELYLCGDLYTLNPNSYTNVVLKWNGFFWQQVGIDFDGVVVAIDNYSNQLFCGGFFKSPASYIAKFDVTTGIPEIERQQIFMFYPNPATDKIVFTAADKGTLTITNQVGQVISTVSIKEPETQVSIDNLQSGMYMLIFRSNKQRSTSKLMISR